MIGFVFDATARGAEEELAVERETLVPAAFFGQLLVLSTEGDEGASRRGPPRACGRSIATIACMRAVMLEVPDGLLAERRRQGHDRFDEMWEGVLHMVPSPGSDHQNIAGWLVATWRPLAQEAGLFLAADLDLHDPTATGGSSYRQPDVVLARHELVSDRGIEGAAELAVEIRSPGDETYEKLPFYERVGVRELLVIETDRAVRHWARQGEHLVERDFGPDAWVDLAALGVRLRGHPEGGLEMEGPAGLSRP